MSINYYRFRKNLENSLNLSKIKNLDWFLVWWASLKVDTLLDIVYSIKK